MEAGAGDRAHHTGREHCIVHQVLLVLAVFAACVVESVEALTIILAVGVTRGWQATMRGAAAGLVVLALVIAVLGPALTLIPIDALRLVVGGLLLIFGLGWLRKAILRASGFKALHDEDAIYTASALTPSGPGPPAAGCSVTRTRSPSPSRRSCWRGWRWCSLW